MNDYHNYLNHKVDEYHDLYALDKGITNYQHSYLYNAPSYGFRYHCDSFQRNLNLQMERYSLNIRKHLVSNVEHTNQLKKIQKDLKCGFIQYLFKTQYKNDYKTATLFKDKHLSDNINVYILSFLDVRDKLAVRFASIYKNRESVETRMKSMTLTSLKRLPHIFDNTHYYQNYGEESKRPLKKILKSGTKNNIINAFLDNLDNLYQNFKGNNVNLQILQQRFTCHIDINTEWAYDRICRTDKYSIHFDPYYITNKYMIACSKALLILRIYSNHKDSQKKEKEIKKEFKKETKRVNKQKSRLS